MAGGSFRTSIALVILVLVIKPSAGKRDVGEASVGPQEGPSARNGDAKAAASIHGSDISKFDVDAQNEISDSEVEGVQRLKQHGIENDGLPWYDDFTSASQAYGPKGPDSVVPIASAELKEVMANRFASALEMQQKEMTEMDENSDANSAFDVSDSGVGSDSLHAGSNFTSSSEISADAQHEIYDASFDIPDFEAAKAQEPKGPDSLQPKFTKAHGPKGRDPLWPVSNAELKEVMAKRLASALEMQQKEMTKMHENSDANSVFDVANSVFDVSDSGVGSDSLHAGSNSTSSSEISADAQNEIYDAEADISDFEAAKAQEPKGPDSLQLMATKAHGPTGRDPLWPISNPELKEVTAKRSASSLEMKQEKMTEMNENSDSNTILDVFESGVGSDSPHAGFNSTSSSEISADAHNEIYDAEADISHFEAAKAQEPEGPDSLQPTATKAHGPKGSEPLWPQANAKLKEVMAKRLASVLEMKQEKMTEMDENSDTSSVLDVSDSGVGSDSHHTGSSSTFSSEIENEITDSEADISDFEAAKAQEPKGPDSLQLMATTAHGPKGRDPFWPRSNAELNEITAKRLASVLEMKQEEMTEMDENSDTNSVLDVSDSGVGFDFLHTGSNSTFSSDIGTASASLGCDNYRSYKCCMAPAKGKTLSEALAEAEGTNRVECKTRTFKQLCSRSGARGKRWVGAKSSYPLHVPGLCCPNGGQCTTPMGFAQALFGIPVGYNEEQIKYFLLELVQKDKAKKNDAILTRSRQTGNIVETQSEIFKKDPEVKKEYDKLRELQGRYQKEKASLQRLAHKYGRNSVKFYAQSMWGLDGLRRGKPELSPEQYERSLTTQRLSQVDVTQLLRTVDKEYPNVPGLKEAISAIDDQRSKQQKWYTADTLVRLHHSADKAAAYMARSILGGIQKLVPEEAEWTGQGRDVEKDASWVTEDEWQKWREPLLPELQELIKQQLEADLEKRDSSQLQAKIEKVENKAEASKRNIIARAKYQIRQARLQKKCETRVKARNRRAPLKKVKKLIKDTCHGRGGRSL